MELHIFGPDFSTLVRSVRLYCEEKGLSYTYGMSLKGYAVDWRSETHRRYHPFGKVPVLFHADAHLFETNAICRYLDTAFPESSLQPFEIPIRTLVDQWSSALVTSVDKDLVRDYLLLVAGPNRPTIIDPATLASAELQVEATLAILDAQLDEHPYLCGEHYSLADALLTPMLDYLAMIPAPDWLGHWPRLGAYLSRMRARPSGRSVLGLAG